MTLNVEGERGEKGRFSEEKIIELLKDAEAGRRVSDLCREHGISKTIFCRWKSKYSGMDGDAWCASSSRPSG